MRNAEVPLSVSGSAIGNNFCVTDAARLRQEITNTKQWIEHTSRMGGKSLRIFAGTVAGTDTEERAQFGYGPASLVYSAEGETMRPFPEEQNCLPIG